MSDEPQSKTSASGKSVSSRVRERLKHARKRFHANDNISGFLEPGEFDGLLLEVEAKFKDVLDRH